MADEPAKTMDDLEVYVNSVEIAAKVEICNSTVNKLTNINFEETKHKQSNT